MRAFPPPFCRWRQPKPPRRAHQRQKSASRGTRLLRFPGNDTVAAAFGGGDTMMRSWIHFTRGRFVRQARVGLGDLREEHLSRQGFAGPVAMLYRTDGPNEVVRVEGDYRSRKVIGWKGDLFPFKL